MKQKIVKNYYAEEVSRKEIPPFSRNHKAPEKKGKDFIIVAACVGFSLITLLNPSNYNNKVRSLNLTIRQYEALKNTIPRVIFDASIYMQQQEGFSMKASLFINE